MQKLIRIFTMLIISIRRIRRYERKRRIFSYYATKKSFPFETNERLNVARMREHVEGAHGAHFEGGEQSYVAG